MLKNSKLKHVLVELGNHLPFSIAGVTMGLILMGILTFLAIIMRAEALMPEASHELFHVFHPVHVLFSAVATTAMFWRHERNLIKAVLVGLSGSLLICALSDILIPFVGGTIMKQHMHLHICVLEHPGLIFSFALTGVIAGLLVSNSIEHSTQYSHGMHVLLSSISSILYLLAYGVEEWTHAVEGVFIVTIVAVVLPCCLSDIVYPLICLHKGCECNKS